MKYFSVTFKAYLLLKNVRTEFMGGIHLYVLSQWLLTLTIKGRELRTLELRTYRGEWLLYMPGVNMECDLKRGTALVQ